MIEVPATLDMIQRHGGVKIKLVPEIRVWCHPARTGEKGEDYYLIFKTFGTALTFIAKNPKIAESSTRCFQGLRA